MQSPSSHEHHEVQNVPHVFTEVSTLNIAFKTKEPATQAEYRSRGLKEPAPKSFAVNNNIIAVVDGQGIVYAALHENGNKYRLEELDVATKQLLSMGYTDAGSSFHVPQFQRPD